jgi:hypothetical protein
VPIDFLQSRPGELVAFGTRRDGASRRRFLRSRRVNGGTELVRRTRHPFAVSGALPFLEELLENTLEKTPSPKIEFGFACQPQNRLKGASRDRSRSPSPRSARPGRPRVVLRAFCENRERKSGRNFNARRLLLFSSFKKTFAAIHRQQVSNHFSRHRQGRAVAISALQFFLV